MYVNNFKKWGGGGQMQKGEKGRGKKGAPNS